MDRISYLPQSILHDILSRLPDQDVVRTSVLSKAWHDTWSNFPLLVFYESRYQISKIPNNADIRQQKTALLLDKYNFCQLVFRTLLRFRCKRLAIRKFKLIFKSLSFAPPALLSRVIGLMDVLCHSGVEVLQFDNGDDVPQHENPRSSNSFDDFACLPLCVLEAKSLIKLKLSWYFRVDQAFWNHPIKFSSLQVLSLKHVYVGDGQVIQNLISSCPLIEKLELIHCSGLNFVSIHDLPKLKVVYIVGIEEVSVDAPSLEDLFYDAVSGKSVTPSKINMDKCTNLRELSLAYVGSIIITDQWFLELFQKFPLLEKLVLKGLYVAEIMLTISSIQLKVLDFCNCSFYDLEEIVIDAPNLYKCAYHEDGSILLDISIRNCSSQLVLDVVFLVDFLLDLANLRFFLEHIGRKHIPVSLLLDFLEDTTVEFDPIELKDHLMAPPSIKHLTVHANSDTEEWSLLLVTDLFKSFHPSIVSFNWDVNKTLIKIFCEKLICRKEDDSCCSSSQIKCWWHFLKDAKVSSYFRSHNVDDDLKTLLEPFPTLSFKEEEDISCFEEEGQIDFLLEWQL